MYRNTFSATICGILLIMVSGCEQSSSLGMDAAETQEHVLYHGSMRNIGATNHIYAAVQQFLDANSNRIGTSRVHVFNARPGMARGYTEPLREGEFLIGIQDSSLTGNTATVDLWMAFRINDSRGMTEGRRIILRRNNNIWSVFSSVETGSGSVRY